MKKQILGRASAILPTATAALLALLAATTATHAQTDTTWTRGAGNGDWDNASNWSAGVPVAGFNAIFGASVGGDPSQIITLAMDKITFASGAASHTAQFQNWNVNAAGTFLEVQSGNTQAQTLAATRNGGGTILLKSGTSTILNNGSSSTGLLFGQIVAANSKLTGASGANSTLVVDGSGITTIGIGQVATAANMVISDGSSGGVLSLTKNGTGTLNLNSANTFSGGLTLQGTGAINLSHSNAAGTGTIFLKYASSSFVAKTLGISGGITVANAIQIDSTTGREAIVSSGTGNNSLTGGITITGAGANSIFFSNEQSSGNLTVSGGISGASYANQLSLRGTQAGNVGFLNGAVTLASGALFDNNGATSWTLNTAGSTWGTTYVRSTGNLILGVNDALATGARVTFDQATSTGGIDLNGFNQTVAGIETTIAITTGNGGRITNNGATNSTLTLAGLSGTRTFNGTITDGSTNKTSLVMNSTGRTQTLNGNNTFSGTTTVTAGTLALGTNLALQNSALDTTGAGTVTFSGTTPTIGGLSGSVNLATKFTTGYSSVTALTLNPQTGVTANYSGAISNGASGMTLTKTGAGTQILSGTNTYTGNTTVSTGTLLINGSTSASSAVSVASGATLGGNGTIGGATTITGILAPGNSIGTLNVTSNVTWVGAATAGATTNWLFELGTSNTSDKLNITGNFLKDTSLGTTFMFDFAGSANEGTFTLVDWTGTTGFSVGDFSYTNLGGGLTGTFNFNGSQLDFIAVPEPSTAWSMAAGLAMVVIFAHRRRRQMS